MVIFSIKLLNNLRKAIAGRRFPHQLAGGLALGVLMGIIPHGNLLAAAVLVVVLCFQVNHALLAVVAIAISFGASNLDAYSHRLGEMLLNHPAGHSLARQAWTLPLVPWTDLNNTVVLGSFVIGLLSVLPVFAISLPVFRFFAPAAVDSALDSAVSADGDDKNAVIATAAHETASADSAQVVSRLIDQPESVPAPRFIQSTARRPAITPASRTPIAIPLIRNDGTAEVPRPSMIAHDDLPSNEQMVSVETRIDVIRMKDFRALEPAAHPSHSSGATRTTEQPMDEALNHLLRQLRHSQERKAAG